MLAVDRPPRRDVYQRARLFDARSFSHHGKANLNLVQALLDAYSDPGETVLDPMAGTGSVYVGSLTGRRVIAGDVEPQWCTLLRDNAAGLGHQSLFALASPGLAVQWDAGRLAIADSSVDLVLTSPPYFDTFSNWDANRTHLVDESRLNEHGTAYGLHPRQIGNLHVYEAYLRAMAAVYAECWRVLVPGRFLVLIVKDVIRDGRAVPVVADNLALALDTGFYLVERADVPARGSKFRNVQRARLGQEGPSTEPVLVLAKMARRPKRRLALVEMARPGDGPGQVIASKAIAHARGRGFEVWTRYPSESRFYLADSCPFDGFGVVVPNAEKARRRREFAFEMVRELAGQGALAAGDEVAFYGGDERYGKYICRRAETLGCVVTAPLKGRNNGQRLAWLTRELSHGAL
jgi:modification methylase